MVPRKRNSEATTRQGESIGRRLPRMTILSDRPADSVQEDLLKLERRLAPVLDILRHGKTQCPVTVAIYGDWGTGKTSAMRWLKSQLEEWNSSGGERPNESVDGVKHPRVYPIWFNPWKYYSREEVWRGIIAEVILTLFKVGNLTRENFRARMAGAAKKFGAFLGRGFLRALGNIELKLPKVAAGGDLTVSGEVFRDVFEEFDKANNPEKAYLNQFEETLRSWVEDFLTHEDARIALFIDDLDRCLPEVTLEVLEAIKLYLSIERIVFIVGLDRDVVDRIVVEHYKPHGLGEEKARRYLDKIFQVEVQVSPSQSEMEEFYGNQVRELERVAEGYWNMLDPEHKRILEAVISTLSRQNPREIKRLLNGALLRGRAAADNEALQGDNLFAQGAQFFLVQRIVGKEIANGANLLQKREFSLWFERWSRFAEKCPKFIYPEDGNIDTSTDPEVRAVMTDSDLRVQFDEILNDRLVGDDGRSLEPKLLLQHKLLWDLLKIPFSAEVAQSAPPIRLPLGESQATQEVLRVDPLRAMPKRLRDRIVQDLKKTPEEITDNLALIKELALDNTEISAADLARLADFPSLESLSLRNSKITDLSLGQLVGIRALKKLYLDKNKITNTGISQLALLHSLETLTLSNNGISDDGLARLAKLPSLRALDLAENDDISDSGLRQLKALRTLETLTLSNAGIKDSGMVILSQFPALQKLYLGENSIGNEGLKDLHRLKALESLDLLGNKITGEALSYLATVDSLRFLILAYTQITNIDKKKFGGLRFLLVLDLRGNKLSLEAQQAIVKSLPDTKCIF